MVASGKSIMKYSVPTVADFNWNRPVVATRKIRQCPLSKDQDVPAGRRGFIQDIADGLVWVDFGKRFGVVPCESAEIR